MSIFTDLSSLNNAIQSQQEVDRTIELIKSIMTHNVSKSIYYTADREVVTNAVDPNELEGQSGYRCQWSDYAIDPIEEECKTECVEEVDPIVDRLATLEMRLESMEYRLMEATNEAAKAKREVANLEHTLQLVKHTNDALSYRVTQLEQKGYTTAAKQYDDNTRYYDMVRRIEQMERDSTATKPYWGQTQITCSGATSVTSLPTGQDLPSFSDRVWPSTVGQIPSLADMTWAELSGTTTAIAGPTSLTSRLFAASTHSYNAACTNTTTGVNSK